MVTKYHQSKGDPKKFFKKINNDTQEYIESQYTLIANLTEALSSDIIKNRLIAKNTAYELARSEMLLDICIEYLGKYPDKIKISPKELETINNNNEKILKLLNEIKEIEKTLLFSQFNIWDILINMND